MPIGVLDPDAIGEQLQEPSKSLVKRSTAGGNLLDSNQRVRGAEGLAVSRLAVEVKNERRRGKERMDGRRALSTAYTKVLNLVKLGPQARRFPHELSGGEQQRIAIARAMANEPISSWPTNPRAISTPASSHEILRIFQDIHAAGTAVLMATHDYPLIDALLPYRRIVLEQGRIVADGIPSR